jgi:hypothetical protein
VTDAAYEPLWGVFVLVKLYVTAVGAPFLMVHPPAPSKSPLATTLVGLGRAVDELEELLEVSGTVEELDVVGITVEVRIAVEVGTADVESRVLLDEVLETSGTVVDELGSALVDGAADVGSRVLVLLEVVGTAVEELESDGLLDGVSDDVVGLEISVDGVEELSEEVVEDSTIVGVDGSLVSVVLNDSDVVVGDSTGTVIEGSDEAMLDVSVDEVEISTEVVEGSDVLEGSVVVLEGSVVMLEGAADAVEDSTGVVLDGPDKAMLDASVDELEAAAEVAEGSVAMLEGSADKTVDVSVGVLV